MVIEITGTIDLGLAPFLERALKEAEADGASAVILNIDTPGGRLDAVLQMRDTLIDSPVRTIAFVNRTAFSAGALIAIASTDIYMTPGAVMGAATPVDGAGNSASAKTISAVRSVFKSTAELRGLDPIVAEAMVDPDIAIPGLVESGQLLTLTTEDAVSVGYTNGVVNSVDELLTAAGLAGATIETMSPSLAERIVRLITNPVLASILITLGILLIIGDLIVAGFGPVGVVGIALLGLFFWGHAIAGLAGWEDLILIGIGLVLIGIEAFVIPGFGIFGIAGLAALAGGFWLAMVTGDYRITGSGVRAGWTVAVSMILVVIGFVIILSLVPRVSRVGGLVLEGTGREVAASTRRPPIWLKLFGGGADLNLPSDQQIRNKTALPGIPLTGKTGTALSDLRPSGIAMIDGLQTDVVTNGEYTRFRCNLSSSSRTRNTAVL